MTIVRTEATSSTWDVLRSDLQAEIGDVLAQRYGTAALTRALHKSASQIWNALGYDPNANMTTANMTYTAGAESVAMPAAVMAAPLRNVVDATNSLRPRPIPMVSSAELERYDERNDLPTETPSDRVCAIMGTELAIRPIPAAALALKLRYVGAFYTPTAGVGDQSPYPINHEECLVLGAAIRLQEVDSEIPPARIARHQQLLEDLKNVGARNVGSTGVVNARRTRF